MLEGQDALAVWVSAHLVVVMVVTPAGAVTWLALTWVVERVVATCRAWVAGRGGRGV